MESYLNLSCHPASSYHAPRIRRKSDQVIDVIWQKNIYHCKEPSRNGLAVTFWLKNMT